MRPLLVLLVIAGCGSSKDKPAAGSGSGSAVAATPDAALARFPGIELPEVTATGDAVERGPTVEISTTAIELDDQALAPLREGQLDDNELEGGKLGMRILKLRAATDKLAAGKDDAARAATTIGLAIDRRQTYDMMVKTIFTMKQKPGFTKYALFVRANGAIIGLPIDLPSYRPDPTDMSRRRPGADLGAQIAEVKESGKSIKIGGPRNERRPPPAERKPADDVQMSEHDAEALADLLTTTTMEEAPRVAPQTDPDQQPIKLAVSITPTDIVLWSISGLEGTLKEPKLKLARSSSTAMAELSKALAEIVARRWPTDAATRDQTILLVANRDIQMQAVAEVIVAVRATPEGKRLFPGLQLSSGFE